MKYNNNTNIIIIITSLLLLLITVDVSGLSCKPRKGGTPVPLGVFTASLNNAGEKAADAVPAIQVALNYIHNHSCILDGFKLQLIYKDTGCTTSLGMRALFELIAARPRPVAIYGGLCTQVNEPVAMALKYWQIVQLSYAETHAKFGTADSEELYPTFFRIVPGDRNVNSARIKFINNFNWKRVGTIKESDEARYSLPHESLTTRLEQGYGVKVVYTAGITMDETERIQTELQILKDKDVRILIVDGAEQLVSLVICEAYRQQLYGEHYVWILPGYHNENWIRNLNVNCTREQFESVLENHFAFEFAKSRKDKEQEIVGGKTAGSIWDELVATGSANHLQGYLYDGLWTLAMALSQSLGKDASFSHNQFLQAIYKTSFEGVTGEVRFENNERLGLIDIKQYKNGKYREVGYFNAAKDKFSIEEELFEDGTIPLDSTIIERKREYISYSLFIIMSLLALIGICLSVIFLLINFKYRDHRFIKMSSPNLNNIIIIGSVCTFLSVIMLGLDTRILDSAYFEKICYIKTWTLCLGFTLSFGSMFSKTWRVHSIFTNIRMDRKAIKDSKLLLILAALLCVDLVVLISWAFISPFKYSVLQLPKITFESKVIIPEIETCSSEKAMIFQVLLYVSKGILMILGCFLAWETRHVNVPALNDSKYIGMSVYGVVVMSVLGLSISVIMQERVNEAFALTSFFIIFSTTLTLCLVFVPKVIELSRNPQGKEGRSYRRGLMKSVVSKTSQQNSTHQKEVDKDLLTKAEQENQLRRRYLHQKSTQLWDLMDQLRSMGDTEFLQQDWCFGPLSSSVVIPSTSSEIDRNHDKDPLLVNIRDESAGCSSGRSDWPWTDPEEPSTML